MVISSRKVVACRLAPNDVSMVVFAFSWPYDLPSKSIGSFAQRHSVTASPPDFRTATSDVFMRDAMSST